MKPESLSYIASAHRDLADARSIFGIGLSRAAARSAYYAAFHAAEAYVYERTGKIVKTHTGLRTEFARLSKDEPTICKGLRSILSDGYRFKQITDYGGSADDTVTLSEAEAIIAGASRFVETITALLQSD